MMKRGRYVDCIMTTEYGVRSLYELYPEYIPRPSGWAIHTGASTDTALFRLDVKLQGRSRSRTAWVLTRIEAVPPPSPEAFAALVSGIKSPPPHLSLNWNRDT